MKMRISDVSRILNIPVETLRFYERNKVVSPYRDDTNNYRYYDTWDIFYIIAFLEFRNMGFSVKEATDAVHTEDIQFVIDTIGTKIGEIKNKIRYDQMMLEYLKSYQEELAAIPYNQGLFWHEIRPELKYIFFSEEENEEYPGMNSENMRFTKWLNTVPYTKGVKHILLDENARVKESDNWSFMMEAKYMDYFDIEEDEYVHTIPQHLCLITYIEGGKRGEITMERFEPVFQYMKEKNITVDGEILCHVMIRGRRNGKFCRFLKVSVPIRNN